MKFLAIICLLGISLSSYADIQAPPGAQHTATRKLSRGLSNIFYGFMEIPTQIINSVTKDPTAGRGGAMYGVVSGFTNTIKRLGYGFYEVVTFYSPSFHGSYRQPYLTNKGEDGRIEMNPYTGLSEFPPILGPDSFYDQSVDF